MIRQIKAKNGIIIKSLKARLTNIFIAIFLIVSFSGLTLMELLGEDQTEIDRDDITVMVWKVIKYCLIVAGSTSGLYMLISGIKYMTSSGNDEETEKAKKGMLFSAIGLIIILMAVVTVQFVLNDILDIAKPIVPKI